MSKSINLLFLCISISIVLMSNLVVSFQLNHNRITKKTNVIQRTYMSAGEETDDEIRDRIRKKMRKNMYNEQGIPYAPWVTKQIDEEAILEDAFRKEKESKIKGKSKTSTIDRGEIEFSEGMKWRVQNDQVDLAWVTGSESNNQGFIVEKRPSYGGDFEEIASFQEVTQLQTKGPSGGRYRYTDPSTASGSWLYRVKDCDTNNVKNIIAQCFVEVQTESESKSQKGIIAGFVGLLAVLAAVGYSLDPPQ